MRVEVGTHYTDCVALVGADTAVDQLLLAFLGGKAPALADLDQGNRQRPRLIADQQDAPVLPLFFEQAVGLELRCSIGAVGRIGRTVETG